MKQTNKKNKVKYNAWDLIVDEEGLNKRTCTKTGDRLPPSQRWDSENEPKVREFESIPSFPLQVPKL